MSDSPGTQFGGPRRKRSADTFGTWFCEARPKGSTDPNAWSTWTQQAGTPRTDISTDPGGTSGQVHTFYDTRVGMEYRFRQTTAKGVVIPSQVASLSGSASGYCNWVVNSLDAGSGVVALRACAVDSLNRVVGIGYLSGSVALGGITINSSGGAAFIMRIMPDGTVDLFKRLAVNDLGSVARGVAIDSQGRITVVGGFNNTIDFGNGKVLVGTLDTSNGSPGDIFVAQFDSNANVLWANAYAPPAGRLSNSNCTGSCVARNTDDSLTVAAWISQSVTFGSVTLNAGIQSDVALFRPRSFFSDRPTLAIASRG